MNIAIITGGNVAEKGISLKSATTVSNHLDSAKYNKYIIELDDKDFKDQESGNRIDKNDFTLVVNENKIQFKVTDSGKISSEDTIAKMMKIFFTK